MQCTRCKRCILSTKASPTPPEDEFKFIDFMGTIAEDQLYESCQNMHGNAILLRKHVNLFIRSFKQMEKVPVLIPVLKNGIPILKLVAATMGAGIIVEAGSMLAEKIWGSLADICQEVAERSCADAMMAAEFVDIHRDTITISRAKSAAMTCFRELYKCFQIESYEREGASIENPSLKEFISRKLLGPMHVIASSYLHVANVLEAQECNARLAPLSRKKPKQLSSSGDGDVFEDASERDWP